MDYLKQFSKGNRSFSGNFPILPNQPNCPANYDSVVVTYPTEPYYNPDANVDDGSGSFCPSVGFSLYENNGLYYTKSVWNTGGTSSFCQPPPFITSYIGSVNTSNRKSLMRTFRFSKSGITDFPGLTIAAKRTETYNPLTNIITYSNITGWVYYDLPKPYPHYPDKMIWDLRLLADGSAWVGTYTQTSTNNAFLDVGSVDVYWPIGSSYCGSLRIPMESNQPPSVASLQDMSWQGYGVYGNQSIPLTNPPGKSLWGQFNADVFPVQNTVEITVHDYYWCI